MNINLVKNEIVVTKSEYAKAMKVGTKEFEELFRIKQMMPSINVVIKRSTNKQNYKRLTKEFMLNYIESHDKDFFEYFKNLFDSIGTTYINKNNGEVEEISFFYIRKVFLEKYPQFMNKEDRIKFEDAKREAEKKVNENQTEENTNVVDMPIVG